MTQSNTHSQSKPCWQCSDEEWQLILKQRNLWLLETMPEKEKQELAKQAFKKLFQKTVDNRIESIKNNFY